MFIARGKGGARAGWGVRVVSERLHAKVREVMLVQPEVRTGLVSLSSHSLRKNGATAAANTGVSEEKIVASPLEIIRGGLRWILGGG